ncbi:MAG: four helix bundle protein [Clostridia bacterium]|nr:four helix bundle protein [Clostridia bacterium]
MSKKIENYVMNKQAEVQKEQEIDVDELAKVRLPKDANELVVLTRAKDLVKYVIIATNKSPKHFRFTLVSKMQNLAFEVVDNLYRANDVAIKKGDAVRITRREEYQRRAITGLKMLMYVSMLANEIECILPKQHEQICKKGAEVVTLIVNWISSDKRRFG